MLMTLSPHSLLEGCPVYLRNAFGLCLVFEMLSIPALGIDRPQRRSMTTARQAKEETHRGIRLH